jgi:hypothetical protein
MEILLNIELTTAQLAHWIASLAGLSNTFSKFLPLLPLCSAALHSTVPPSLPSPLSRPRLKLAQSTKESGWRSRPAASGEIGSYIWTAIGTIGTDGNRRKIGEEQEENEEKEYLREEKGWHTFIFSKETPREKVPMVAKYAKHMVHGYGNRPERCWACGAYILAGHYLHGPQGGLRGALGGLRPAWPPALNTIESTHSQSRRVIFVSTPTLSVYPCTNFTYTLHSVYS